MQVSKFVVVKKTSEKPNFLNSLQNSGIWLLQNLRYKHMSAAEQLRRLEEAMAFLRQHLAAGPQPARKLLKAANAAGIAERTLHRAKDLLGVTTERSGGYAAYGQWVWFPPASPSSPVPVDAHEAGALVAEQREAARSNLREAAIH